VDTSGYYDPYPRITLPEPVVLLGLPGAQIAAIGFALSSVAGIRLHLVGRSVEHRQGRSRSRIALESGLDLLHGQEAEVLLGALQSRPAGLVIAPEGLPLSALPEAERAFPAAISCYVRRPADDLLEAVHAQHEASRGSVPDYVLGPPVRPEDLGARFQQQDRAYASAADHVIEAGDRHPHRIAQELSKQLNWPL
jgi:shikimate kinase